MYCQWSLFHLNSRARRENPTCVTFTILDICRSVQQVIIFFSYQCKSTPIAGLKGQEVTRSLLPPVHISPHCGSTSWPSLSRRDVRRLVEGGSSNCARCLSWKTRGCFRFSEHILRFPLAAESFDLWKGKVWGVEVKGLIRLGPHRRLSDGVEGEHLLWQDTELMF